MRAWHKVKLGSVCSKIGSGATPSGGRNSYSATGRFSLIRSQNVLNDGLSEQGLAFISDAQAKKLDGVDVRSGDVLLNITGDSVARSCMVTDNVLPARVNQHVAILRADETNLIPAFLRYFLISPQQQRKMLSLASAGGATRNALTKSGVENFQIPLPPLPEQIAIARVLSAWDEAIAHASALLAAKTRFKRALMQELLTGERRFAEFEGQAWRVRRLGDVTHLTFRPVVWDEDETYRLASVRRNSGGLFSRESLRGRDIKVKKLHTIREGDFLVSHIQAAYGAMGRVPSEFDGAQVSEMYSILTPCAPDSIDIGFLNYLSQLPLMHQKVLLSSNGFFAERLRLNFDPLQFTKQTFTLPTIEEQRRIAGVLGAASGEIETRRRQLEAFKTQKRALMQLLLSGEVRVPLAVSGATPEA